MSIKLSKFFHMNMIGSRLKEERERLGLSQEDFASIAGSTRKTQFNYESGVRYPDAEYLGLVAKRGVDIKYVITGSRDSSTLPPIEQTMLTAFRGASLELQGAVLNVLLSGKVNAPAFQQTFHGGVGSVNKIETDGGTVDLRVDMRGKK